jgi:F0F1-type ATP synthase epsilon subunit
MLVTIASLKGKQFEGEAKSVNLTTRTGDITVLDNHRPLITILASGVTTIRAKDDKESTFKITGGFLEMDDKNHLKLLID